MVAHDLAGWFAVQQTPNRRNDTTGLPLPVQVCRSRRLRNGRQQQQRQQS